MSLIVEDGTGRADAESYASVSVADAYHTARGNTAWAALATTALKEAALRKATDYLGQTYGLRWKGYRMTTTQALDWPRELVCRPGFYGEAYYASDAVPTILAQATCELALRASAGDLLDDGGQEVIREKVGAIETEYQPASRFGPTYPAVDRLLAPLVSAHGVIPLAKA